MVEGGQGLSRRDLLLSGTAFLAHHSLLNFEVGVLENTMQEVGFIPGSPVEAGGARIYSSLDMSHDLEKIISELNPKVITEDSLNGQIFRNVAVVPMGTNMHLEVSVAVHPRYWYENNSLTVLSNDTGEIVKYAFTDISTSIDISNRRFYYSECGRDNKQYMNLLVKAMCGSDAETYWKEVLEKDLNDKIHTIDEFVASMSTRKEDIQSFINSVPVTPVSTVFLPPFKSQLSRVYGSYQHINTDFFEGLGLETEPISLNPPLQDSVPEPEYQI